jgi:hypothetical protein
MMVPEGDVHILARAMIKNYPADAADRAAFRSNAFFVLGHVETSEKWLLVSEEIKKIRAGQAVEPEGGPGLIDTMAPEEGNSLLPVACRANSHPATRTGSLGDAATEPNIARMTESQIPVLIAMVAWSELMWLLAQRANG